MTFHSDAAAYLKARTLKRRAAAHRIRQQNEESKGKK